MKQLYQTHRTLSPETKCLVNVFCFNTRDTYPNDPVRHLLQIEPAMQAERRTHVHTKIGYVPNVPHSRPLHQRKQNHSSKVELCDNALRLVNLQPDSGQQARNIKYRIDVLFLLDIR